MPLRVVVLKTGRWLSPLMLGLVIAGCDGNGSSSSGEGRSSPFVIEGSMGIEANTRVDGDTSDRLSFGGVRLTEPQLLPATFVLGGYLSEGFGFRNPGDPFDNFAEDQTDRFQIPFKAGEEVSVATFVNGSVTPDVTLRLLALDETELASVTITAGEKGLVELPVGNSDGDYLVELSAGFSSPSAPIRYVAMKVSEAAGASMMLDWPRHDYVPGRAIVSQSPGSGVRASAMGQANGLLQGRLGDRHWLMRMADARMASATSPRQETLAWIEELRRQPGVASAVPDYVVSAQSPVDEPLYPLQWHYDLIDAPTAWQIATGGGGGTVVAVLDSGLFFDEVTEDWHPDLSGNVVADSLLIGSDFVDGDNLPADAANDVGSSVFHGTHVAGTVAASASNSDGGTGVAFDSGLLPVRVLGEGGTGSSSDLIAALGWILEGGSPKAQIVNLSLGGLPEIPALQDVINQLVDQNVIVVAAAGNQSTSTPTFPAAADKVFSVSAVDGAGNLASYSNFGPWIDLAAPGGDGRRDANLDGRADLVISASASFSDGRFRPDYAGLQGTSMAAPHVAGVFALMKSIKPDLNYSTLNALLVSGELTTNEGGTRTDSLGYGVINAAKAVLVATNSPDITVLSASPSVVSLSSETNPEQLVELKVSGAGSVEGVEPISSPDWLSVSLQDSPLSLMLSLNEEKLEPGVPVRSKLEVAYTSDKLRTLEIPVVAQLVTDQLARDAGQHFVLLVNTEPEDGFFRSEAQILARVSDGQYEFDFRFDDGVAPKQLDEVSPGRYFLVAGTDLDNDGLICQSGEGCAEYPVSGLREVIEIDENSNLTDIRMTTGFSRPGISSASPDILPRPDFVGYRLMNANPGSLADPKSVEASR